MGRSRRRGQPRGAAATVPPPPKAPVARPSPLELPAGMRRVLANAAPWIVTLVAAALRFHALDREPFWFDEAYTALSVQLPVGGILERLRGEGNAPLYYLLMHGWSGLFGDGVYAFRFVSALLGTMTIPLLYWVGRRMFSGRAALIAATLAAVSPLHIHYSQEARMYPLVPLFAVAALYGLDRLVVAPTAWTAMAFAAALLGGLYTQYYFLFFVPLAAAALLGSNRWRSVLCAGGALLLVALGFAPWIPSFIDQATNSSPDWIGGFWRHRSLAVAVPWSLESLGPGALYPGWSTFKFMSSTATGTLSLAFAALVVGGAFIRLFAGWMERAHSGEADTRVERDPTALALTLGAVLVPLCLACAASLVRRPVYVVARYDLIAWGAYCLLSGAVLARFKPPIMLAAVALWLGVSSVTLWPYLTTERPKRNYADMGDRIAQALMHRARPGESVVFTAATRTMAQYYLRAEPERFRMMSYPLGTDAHLGWIDDAIQTNPRLAADEGRRFAAALVDGGEPPAVIWLVAPRSRGTAPLLGELRSRGYVEDRQRSLGSLLLCLRREATS
jgi:Dolichyl-phosphate-mannose-protein mannosyltransferase